MPTEPVLRVRGLRFAYESGSPVLDVPALDVAPGESVFLRGSSGSGKSTLLSLIGGIHTAEAGTVQVCGAEMGALGPGARDRLRGDRLGIIFQQLNLLPYLDVLGNVALGCRFSPSRAARARAQDGSVRASALRLLDALGLPESLQSRPVSQLSVGQQQRVAAARALIGSPDLLVADEPTSALDARNRDRFIALLDQERQRSGCALLFVSHDQALAPHFDRTVDLEAINTVERA